MKIQNYVDTRRESGDRLNRLTNDERFAVQVIDGNSWQLLKVDEITTKEEALQTLEHCSVSPNEARVVEVSLYPVEVVSTFNSTEFTDYAFTAFRVIKVKLT